ncbi:CBL-interacting protein kinase 25 [Apostasia shenzhenica]|uniref:non-specific serine/threonine protein kinase n=1 Tax=Apostasia shenzhenica TaxID=1088818 RepID=A0A2H9ZVL9_9ASPA|nr:CBL-interacting protein kinase 25 [Apostasia shenzhenica]
MWKFNPFTHKESASLEGRSIDVGNMKVHVRNPIAEGGFSCVYLARDAVHSSKQYALKHIICNDGESLELVIKEISVMKLLKGHPNIIKLLSYAIIDMGRTKEALLVMEFCEKSLVSFLESGGAGYLEEKHILLIFRDVCNAVFAMHCQKPPIAHRDLKAENVLLGADGTWKLCDFGSTSSNHKCFSSPEEMGVEEDNIRKNTTPAYRSPEMWDLYRRDVISEKVDIWALGCLLYRVCYMKSAFDGESKLQITNVNYHIPDVPKYNAALIGLIKDMIQGSPNARPDITQVWFRVNELLPNGLQKHLPDSSLSAVDTHPRTTNLHQEGSNMMPRRNPPPSNENGQRIITSFNGITQQSKHSQSITKSSAPIGSFWSTQHAHDLQSIQDKDPPQYQDQAIRAPSLQNKHGSQKSTPSHSENKAALPTNSNPSVALHDSVDTVMNSLRDQLRQANIEKAEIASKYEKLTAICHSQRQEIQELKQALAAATRSPPSKESSKCQASSASLQPTSSQKANLDPNLLELEQAMLANSTTSAAAAPEPKPWEAFFEESKANNAMSGLPWSCTPSQSTRQFNQVNCSSTTHSFQITGSATAPARGVSSQKFDTSKPTSWAAF